MTTQWTHPRYPLADNVQNLLRCEDYWKYLLLHHPKDEMRPAIIVYKSYQLKSITSPAQADYEAFHMVHSVGLNYDKYANECSIYSIRTQDNIPFITFNIKQSTCVHARARGNLPLNDQQLILLRTFCTRMHWSFNSSL